MQCLIQVTAEHIANGKPYNPFACPVALAIKEKVNEEVKVCVGPFELMIFVLLYKKHVQKLPKEIKEFMGAFDKKQSCHPWEFTLDIPTEFCNA